jgi:hypothetical protein
VDVCRPCAEGTCGDLRTVVVTLTHTVELTVDPAAVDRLARRLGIDRTTVLGQVADRLGLAAREPDPITWDDAYWRTTLGAVALVDVDAEAIP